MNLELHTTLTNHKKSNFNESSIFGAPWHPD